MNTANYLTMSRIALIPVFMVFLTMDDNNSNIIALIIFVIASVTDAADGYIARRFNQVTTFGKFMDPLADKLLVTTAIIYFVHDIKMAPWAAVIIIMREFAVTSLRMIAVADGQVIAAGLSGKIKTFVQIFCIGFLLTPLWNIRLGNFSLSNVAVLIMVAVTVWSGVDYIIRHRDIIKPNS